MPSFSPGLGGRVVAEMLRWSELEKRSISCRTIVDLPTPEGPERTISLPDLVGVIRLGDDERPGDVVFSDGLFDILNLFTDAFNGRLHLDNSWGNLRVVGFRADRVRFAKHLLGNEFEFPTGPL